MTLARSEKVQRAPEIRVSMTNDGTGYTWTRTQVGELRENGGTFPTMEAALLNAYQSHSENDLLAFVESFVREGCHHSCTEGRCSHAGNERMKAAKALLAKATGAHQ